MGRRLACSCRATFFQVVFVLLATVFPTSSLFPTARALAQSTLDGDWTFVYFQAGTETVTQTFKLIQFNQSVSGSGNEEGNSVPLFISGAFEGPTLTLITTYSGFSFLLVSTGTVAGDGLLSGTWEASNDTSGTWNARRTSSTPSLVTPNTKLEDPPVVTVTSKKVTLLFEPFSDVGTFGRRSTGSRVAIEPRAKAKNSFRYDVEIKRVSDQNGKRVRNEVSNKTSKRNQLTLNSLKPGNYSAKYRVEITKKEDGKEKVVGTTKFSPPASFAIAP